MGALGEATEDGVPIVGGGSVDAPENLAGEGEVTGGGGEGAELEELGSGSVELEFPGGDEMGLELLDVNERDAFLQQ